MDRPDWIGFVKALRAEQDRLRAELGPYEDGTMRVGRRSPGGIWEDFTEERIATINGEVASLQRTIDRVIAEQGLRDA